MIKLDSWHYKLANFGDRRIYPGDSVNFCEYFRSVLCGLFVLSLMIFVGGAFAFLGGIIIVSFYHVLMHLFYGDPLLEVYSTVAGVSTIFLVSFGIGHLVSKYNNYRYELKRNRPKTQHKSDGFFSLAYRKFKDKTCFIVDIEDKQ